MKSFNDDTGIAYGLLMMVIALAIGIFAWMFVGIVMDHLEGLYNSMSYLFSDTMGNRVTDTVNIYSYLPFFFIVTAVIYLVVRGLRRGDGDVY